MSSKQAKAYLERASKRQQKARPPRATLNRSPRQAARHPPVRLTSKRWAELTSVNRRVNRSLIARSDGASHAGLDVWSVSGRYGDCEDFAIRKRDALIRLGWSAHAVLMTVAKTSAGEPHAVLIARTDKGDFVLDNLRPQVTAWQDVPYRWVKRQSQDDPSKWVRLTGG
ncbi:MAG: transglutaminase-like cysteine peptidase [Hyphomicrobiales bacterium]|nr:transglutaminase-like cysteine peptidase [Hyphomicrobiales bacterium]